jgi:hypothetical protein
LFCTVVQKDTRLLSHISTHSICQSIWALLRGPKPGCSETGRFLKQAKHPPALALLLVLHKNVGSMSHICGLAQPPTLEPDLWKPGGPAMVRHRLPAQRCGRMGEEGHLCRLGACREGGGGGGSRRMHLLWLVHAGLGQAGALTYNPMLASKTPVTIAIIGYMCFIHTQKKGSNACKKSITMTRKGGVCTTAK